MPSLWHGTRSCGRFGPARLGSTVERSSSIVSVYTGSAVVVGAEQALRLRVRFDKLDMCGFAPGRTQVVERIVVDREEPDRRPILRAHVRERRAIGNGQCFSRAIKLDELPDHTLLTQHLGDGEHEVGRRGAFW